MIFLLRVIDGSAMHAYQTLASNVTYDRTGRVVRISLNQDEQVCMFATAYPRAVSDLVLEKEDQWFYYHPGINPYRTLVSAIASVQGTPSGGGSTLTQQLAKTLLHNTGERTLTNKIVELELAVVLELGHTKDEILTMYLNTVPLGGNIQGFPAAARAYFDKQVSELNQNEILQLVAALSSPTNARPLSETNLARSLALAQVLGATPPLPVTSPNVREGSAWLELGDLLKDCTNCTATLDVDLTERIRDILHMHIGKAREYGITAGAVAVIDVTSGEILALVGSPAPDSNQEGMRINMALQTRPIGSTIKPFLYLLGFSKGLRPYTLVDDREYKFEIETGFPLYPKNYDGAYRGTVTLEEALANSLNVPTVEVLSYDSLEDTYSFLERVVGFKPPQPWESYAYGIALGGLELDLVTLTQAFTALADGGQLKRLISAYTQNGEPFYFRPPHSLLIDTRQIGVPKYVALVNAILTDRTAGVEQFGQAGSLFLSHPGYAVKTGTSRDYHDSWTVGYTGDFAVGVWLGNVENRPMNGVSGSTGAGTVWHDVMELMFTTPYYHETPLDLSPVVAIPSARGYSYGLADDDIETARGLLADNALILFPHEHDTFLFSPGMRIPLSATEEVVWSIAGEQLKEDAWYPTEGGTYTITARTSGREEQVNVTIADDPFSLP